MSKIILTIFLLFAGIFLVNIESKAQIISSQETFFTIGDTTETFNVPSNATRIVITVVDSSLAGVDTVFVKGITGISGNDVRYSLLSVYDLARTAQATLVTSMIPTNGLTKSYLLTEVPWRSIQLVRSNESTDDLYAPKTRIVVTYIR